MEGGGAGRRGRGFGERRDSTYADGPDLGHCRGPRRQQHPRDECRVVLGGCGDGGGEQGVLHGAEIAFVAQASSTPPLPPHLPATPTPPHTPHPLPPSNSTHPHPIPLHGGRSPPARTHRKLAPARAEGGEVVGDAGDVGGAYTAGCDGVRMRRRGEGARARGRCRRIQHCDLCASEILTGPSARIPKRPRSPDLHHQREPPISAPHRNKNLLPTKSTYGWRGLRGEGRAESGVCRRRAVRARRVV
jgi:hypothetical protein